MDKNVEERLFAYMIRLPHFMRAKMMSKDMPPQGPGPEGFGPRMHGPGMMGPGHGPMGPGRCGGPGHGPMGPGGPMGHGPGRGRRFLSRERVLEVLLAHEEGVRQKTIAEELKVNPSSMSEFIDRLEADGYIDRNVDPADKRATLIRLTEKGKARAFELQDERTEKLRELFGALSEEEKEELLKILEKLVGGEPEE